MKYSEYGLDETKITQDDGNIGLSYCPWCQDKVKTGFSMCFSNFCICKRCIQNAEVDKTRWRKGDEFGCFKCDSKVKQPKLHNRLYFDKAGSLSICESCLIWAKEVLKIKNISDMTLKDVLQQCTVDGNLIKLPEIELPKALSNQVNKKLEEIGGEWSEEKNGFEYVTEDAEKILNDVINSIVDKKDESPAEIRVLDTHTNFFQQLAALGHVDLTIRIMQKDDKLTIGIDPGFNSKQQPINVTGTPADLDQDFFTEIAPNLSDIKGLITNINEIKEEVSKKPATSNTVNKSVTQSKKQTVKKKSPKKAAVVKEKTAKVAKPKKEKAVAEKMEQKQTSGFVPMEL